LATAPADRIARLLHRPGEKAQKIIFVREDIIRHQFLPHAERRSVPCAIAKIPRAVQSGEILAHLLFLFVHSEENAFFRQVAVAHAGSFVC
jgi:hypothetical protein